jgi:Zn-dependent alcohol dehydrogenase
VRRGQTKLACGRDFGATNTINPVDTDVDKAIEELIDSFGVDMLLDAAGSPATWTQPRSPKCAPLGGGGAEMTPRRSNT